MTDTQTPPTADHQPSAGAASGGAGATCHPIAAFGVRVNAVLDTLADSPAWALTPEERKAALLDLQRAEAGLAELKLRVLASADNDEIGRDEAASSTAAWLRHHARVERKVASGEVRLSHQLDHHEPTRRALARGEVNTAQARAIVDAVDDLPEEVTAEDRARAEAHLIGEAERHDARGLRALGRRLFEVIAPEDADRRLGERLEAEEREARRTTALTLRDNGDGTVSGNFKLPLLAARMLEKTIRALVAPARIGPSGRLDEQGRKVPERELLGRGFVEMIERFPHNKLPKAGGVNATVVVTMTEEQLRGDLGVAQLDTGEPISAAEARRLCAAADLIPMVLSGDSVPLDVGRKRRLHDDYQRMVMGYRDKTCTAVGCDRPASWCESHHRTEWAHGGRTSVKDGRPVSLPPSADPRQRLSGHRARERQGLLRAPAVGVAGHQRESAERGHWQQDGFE